jgi:hypothetical protein
MQSQKYFAVRSQWLPEGLYNYGDFVARAQEELNLYESFVALIG